MTATAAGPSIVTDGNGPQSHKGYKEPLELLHPITQCSRHNPLLLIMCAVNEVSKARQDKEQGFSNNISSVNVDFYSYTQRAGEDVSGLNILTTVHSSLQRKFLQCQVWKYWSAL